MVHGPTQTEKEMIDETYNELKKEPALVFRIKCIAKKCREKGKWDLLSRLCYKYSWIDLTAGEADYD